MIFIGQDNGCTGSIGIIRKDNYYFYKTPTFSTQNYQTSKDSKITRIDFDSFVTLLEKYSKIGETFALIERPLNNPRLYKASLSAMRSLEASLIAFEKLKIPYKFIDSKIWQGEYLKVKGSKELKKASREIGSKLFELAPTDHDDYDGLFIAKYLSEHLEDFFKI